MSTARLEGVTALTKANVYYDGRVVSHALILPDGSKKTLGLMYPGEYHFRTDAPEHVELVAGACRIRIDGSSSWQHFDAGASFRVPGSSSFDIAIEQGITEYVCTFE